MRGVTNTWYSTALPNNVRGHMDGLDKLKSASAQTYRGTLSKRQYTHLNAASLVGTASCFKFPIKTFTIPSKSRVSMLKRKPCCQVACIPGRNECDELAGFEHGRAQLFTTDEKDRGHRSYRLSALWSNNGILWINALIHHQDDFSRNYGTFFNSQRLLQRCSARIKGCRSTIEARVTWYNIPRR